MRHAICYVSNANPDLSLPQIEDLLNLSKTRNELLDIKGLLLYSECNFFQIIEGEKDIAVAIFQKIEQDPRHHGLIQIMGKDITQGSCDGFKVDILNGDILNGGRRHGYEIPPEYLVPLQCISPQAKKSLERMLRMFVATR